MSDPLSLEQTLLEAIHGLELDPVYARLSAKTKNHTQAKIVRAYIAGRDEAEQRFVKQARLRRVKPPA